MRNSGVSGRVFGTPKLDTCHYSWILLRGFLPMENLRSSTGEKKGDMHRGDALLPVNNCKIVSINICCFFLVLLNTCFLLVPKIDLCSDFLPKTKMNNHDSDIDTWNPCDPYYWRPTRPFPIKTGVISHLGSRYIICWKHFFMLCEVAGIHKSRRKDQSFRCLKKPLARLIFHWAFV